MTFMNIPRPEVCAYLAKLLKTRLKPEGHAWLVQQAEALAQGAPDKTLFLAFSQAVRHSGKAALAPTPEESAEARALVAGWDLSDWTCDVAARAYLMASLPDGSDTSKVPGALDPAKRLLAVHQTADLGEHVALVKALFLAPRCEDAMHIAREGLRSNMRSVFAGITSRNPYPALYFDELAFNQMVVKCLFVDLPLREITGLDGRLNPTLRQILVDLAHERWAAERPVSGEMWRCVGPFADAKGREGMLKALTSATPSEARGAALGLMADTNGNGPAILQSKAPEWAKAIREGKLTWENFDHA